MMSRASVSAILIAITSLSIHNQSSAADDLLAPSAFKQLGGQRYWELRLPLAGDEMVARIALLEDNLYAVTDKNNVFAVHSLTGILRWSTVIADEGVTIRGPSHAAQYVFFTTPGAVRAFNRRTGELASEPRTLRGVIIEVVHDTATVTVGQVHGVRNGDILGVYRLTDEGESDEQKAIAQLRITSIDSDRSKGRLVSFDKRNRPRSGDRVMAKVVLPLKKIKLPFAASSAAVADNQRIYVGAANQRFYSLDILSGFQHWQLLTPKTVSSTPTLSGADLIFAGLDGRIVSCTKVERSKNWIFETEGPVFADLFLDDSHVYAASSDRSLYCLDRRTGRRIWRDRFETPLTAAPVVSEGRVYQQVPLQGLFVLDAKTGKHLWERPEGGRFLVQFEGDAYLLAGEGTHQLVRVEAATGREKAVVDTCEAAYAAGSVGDHCILLASKTGALTCLRSSKAPRLKPAQLVEVLRNDRKIRLHKEMDAKRTAELAKKKLAAASSTKKRSTNLFEEDWLRSRKTGRPVGGRGLIEVEDEADEEEELEEEDEDEEEEDEFDEEDEDGWDEDDELDEDEEDEDDEDEDEEDEDEVDDDELDEDDEGDLDEDDEGEEEDEGDEEDEVDDEEEDDEEEDLDEDDEEENDEDDEDEDDDD